MFLVAFAVKESISPILQMYDKLTEVPDKPIKWNRSLNWFSGLNVSIMEKVNMKH